MNTGVGVNENVAAEDFVDVVNDAELVHGLEKFNGAPLENIGDGLLDGDPERFVGKVSLE